MDYKKAKVSENSHVTESSIDQLGVRIWGGARVENSDFDENVSIGNDVVNITLHFFLKDIRPMLPPAMNHSIAVS